MDHYCAHEGRMLSEPIDRFNEPVQGTYRVWRTFNYCQSELWNLPPLLGAILSADYNTQMRQVSLAFTKPDGSRWLRVTMVKL